MVSALELRSIGRGSLPVRSAFIKQLRVAVDSGAHECPYQWQFNLVPAKQRYWSAARNVWRSSGQASRSKVASHLKKEPGLRKADEHPADASLEYGYRYFTFASLT